MYISNKKEIELLPIKKYKDYKNRLYNVHIGVPLMKSTKRFKWILEKSVEIGVDEITPLYFNKYECYKKFNKTRYLNIIKSSLKQSKKSKLPILNEKVFYNTFLNIRKKKSIKIIAHCKKNFKRNFIKDIMDINITNYIIIIGPEKDFSINQIEEAMKLGWNGVKISFFPLKIETASIISLYCIYNFFYEKKII